MRTRSVSSFLLSAALVLAAPAAGQSVTELSAGLSVGLFDDVGIGLGGSVAHATGIYADYGDDPDYGIYSNSGRAKFGGYRYGGSGRSAGYDSRGYSDYCWDRSWDLRWNRSYYHGYDGWGRPTYDHLDFYHDCMSSGIDYAYSRWDSHARRDYRWHRPWGVIVNVYVTDPFWRPWGPYWAYDPWGWYWDGRGGRYGSSWGQYGGVVYAGGPTRTVWVDRGYGAGRASPLAGPRFKEDPIDGGVRTATPRGGRATSAPAVGERLGRPGASAAPAAPGGRRPADVGRALAPQGTERGEPRALPRPAASPRERPSDAARSPSGERGAVGRAAPAAPVRERGSREGAADVGRRGAAAPATPRGDDSPSARARPDSERATERPEPRVTPRGEPREAPRSEPRGEPRSGPRPAPRAEPRSEPRPAPRAEPRVVPQSAPRERSAPAARSGGDERSAPAERSGGSSGASESTTPRRRGESEGS